MSFSIYNLDEEIRKLLTLDNFLGGMTVNEFIEELSRDHFLKGAEVNKLEYLDPKPYIRTFELTLRDLKLLHEHSETKKRAIELEVESIELKHSENVLGLSSNVDQLTSGFEQLDTKILQVTSRIDPLGQTLNRITNSRDRSKETIFLIRAYHGFYTKERYEPLEKLKDIQSSYADKVQCARTCVNLLNLAKKITQEDGQTNKQTAIGNASMTKAQNCVSSIEKFNETFEKELLIKFEMYFENDEYEKMKEIASILHTFNGGATVVQLFVNKHDFMLEGDNTEDSTMLDDEAIWIKLCDPNYGEAARDELTEQLLDTLRMSIKAQARIVQQVFEDLTPVLKIFIQRIYAQIIQNKISALLQYLLLVGALAHVRVLHALFVLVGDFTREVKEFLAANDLDPDEELAIILEQCNYDLFIEYTLEEVYFGREKKNLEETIYSIVSKYHQVHEAELANRELATKLDNIDNYEYNEAEAAAAAAASTSAAASLSILNLTLALQDRFLFHFLEKKRLSHFKNFMKLKHGSAAQNAVDFADHADYAQLNTGIVETVVKLTIELISRVLELAPAKTPEFVLEILEILLFDFGKLYIGSCLEVAFDSVRLQHAFIKSTTAATSSLSNPPHHFKFDYLEVLNLTSEALFLISLLVKKVVLPCAINAPPIRDRMCNLVNNYINRCEVSINFITQETLELIANRIAYLLTKQKKRDFVVETITDEEDTEACEGVSDFLIEVHENVPHYLQNANLRNFLIKVGLNLINQLLEHYKKFAVNSTGGIILTKDAIRFQAVIDQWKIPELLEHMSILKEIGNLFTVHPDLINSLVSEGQLATLKPYLIRQYVMKRADFNPSYLERFFSMK